MTFDIFLLGCLFMSATPNAHAGNGTWSGYSLDMVERPSAPIAAGSGVTIKCETDRNFSIYWYRNGIDLSSIFVTPSERQASDGGTIYISQLTFTARKEDNQVNYECKINNQTSFRKDVTITVHFPPNGILLSETSISVKEGSTKTITCSTSSSSNPAVIGLSVKKKLGSSEVDVTGIPRVTNGDNSGKDVRIDIKLDTNRSDNGAQYICSFIHAYATNTFTKTATVHVQCSFRVRAKANTHDTKTDVFPPGVVAGTVVAAVGLLIVIVVVMVGLRRRSRACFSGRTKSEDAALDDSVGTSYVTRPAEAAANNPIYVNVINMGFKGDNEDLYEEMKNPYAKLSIAPDVIADQTYAELQPRTSKQSRK